MKKLKPVCPSPPDSNQSVPDRLFLTGYMGAGKSTVGKLLARRLNYRLYDTDHLLAKGFHKPVSRIFKENGEEAFRKAEVEVLEALIKRAKVVISSGGGTLVRPDTFELARKAGVLIYLRAPIEVLYERVVFSPKDRPIIDVPESEGIFRERFAPRQEYYERSEIVVDTVDRRPDDVVNEIMEKLYKLDGRHAVNG